MKVAESNASAGWVAGVIGVHRWQLALFPEQAQEEMWTADASVMHSSSYAPTGTARQVSGGYRVSGRWSFSSGCDHCRAVNFGAVAGMRTLGDTELPDFHSFILYCGQYQIIDNWQTTGMRGTDSKDIVVDDVLVPEHGSQSHLDYAFNISLPGREKNDDVLYRLPWAPVFNLALAGAVIGSAQAFLDTWLRETLTRTIPFSGPAADDPLFQQRAAEAMWTVDAARLRIRADATMMWETASSGEVLDAPARARVRWNTNHALECIGAMVGTLMRAASGRAIFEAHPLRRLSADIQGMVGHAFLVPDPLARAVGGVAPGSQKPTGVM